MKNNTALRKIAPIVALVCILMATIACTSNKKYGCPNHLKTSFSLR
ncbi:MAG: hypothetical protein V4561_13405 [Bacteroidota bacterium]